MTIAGIYSLYLVGPRYVIFFLLFWLIVWALQIALAKLAQQKSKNVRQVMTFSAIILTLSPMLMWKLYPQEFSENANFVFSKAFWALFPAAGPADAIFGMIVPLGLSFAVFRALDLLIKVRLEILEPVSLGRTFYFRIFPSNSSSWADQRI